MKRLFVILSVLFSGIGYANAYKFTVDGITYANSSSSTCYVTYEGDTYVKDAGTGYSGDIVIPSSVTYDNRQFEVTAVGDHAFYYCTSLKSVVLPNTIKDIGKCAFYECYSLSSVNIPDGITVIDDYAFADCNVLSSIILPNTVVAIGEHSFGGCGSLSSINFPESLSKINEYAFVGTALVNIKIPQKLNIIGEKAFCNCDSLVSVVADTLNDVYIGEGAFYRCNALQYVKLAKASLGYEAFYECDKLLHVTIDGELSMNEKGLTFLGCDSLKIVEINGACSKIPVRAFYNCPSLETITLPKSMKEIGREVFYWCKSLKSIEIPEGITLIDEQTFYACDSLSSVKFPHSLKTVGKEAFYCCSKLDSIVFHGPVDIGEKAFYRCKSVRSFIHYDGDIDREAFGGCESLTTLYSVAITPPIISGDSFYDDNANADEKQHITVYVPRNSWEKYMDDEEWGLFPNLFSGPAVETISLNTDTLNLAIGESDTLTVNILPESVLNKHVKWYSNNEKVATIDQNGVVIAKSTGNTYIRVGALEGETVWKDDYFDRVYLDLDGILYADCIINVTTTGIIQTRTEFPSTYTVYNLQGMCLLRNVSKLEIDTLPKGLYIVNGKKRFLK